MDSFDFNVSENAHKWKIIFHIGWRNCVILSYSFFFSSRSRQRFCDSGNCFEKKKISNGINTGKLRTKKKKIIFHTRHETMGETEEDKCAMRTYSTYPRCVSEFVAVNDNEIFRFIERSRFSLKYDFKMSSKTVSNACRALCAKMGWICHSACHSSER